MNILIDTIRIAGFRGIKNLEVSLPRVTVLIGTNNSGKTSLLKALQLALGNYSRYLSEEDFHIGADDKRVSEILVDVRIVPVDGDGIRTQKFNDEWATEFGDKIKAETNTNQFVALRTRAAPNIIKGRFDSKRSTLERWPDLKTWQTEKIKETNMLNYFESIPFISIEAQRDIHHELKERSSFIGKVLSSVEDEYNQTEITMLESLIKNVNDRAVDESSVLQNLKTHLEKLNHSFEGSGSAEITPFPKKIRDLSKHFSIHFGESSSNTFSLEYHGMGTRSWACRVEPIAHLFCWGNSPEVTMSPLTEPDMKISLIRLFRRVQFCYHPLPASEYGGCVPVPTVQLSVPFLHRHYPASSVL